MDGETQIAAPALAHSTAEALCSTRAVPRRPLHRFGEALLDVFFPPHCAACGQPLSEFQGPALCTDCCAKLHWIGPDRCRRCGDRGPTALGAVEQCVSCVTHPPRFLNGIASVLRYEEGPARALMLALKFGSRLHLARAFGRALARRITETGLLSEPACVLAAPCTRSTLLNRGYNQAEEIAEWVAHELQLQNAFGLLRKVRHTPPQALLSAERRRENLADAFTVSAKVARRMNKDMPILLIDDVITTCSTVSECARSLHAAGFTRVAAASFARG